MSDNSGDTSKDEGKTVTVEQFNELMAAVNDLKAENARLKDFADKTIQEKKDMKTKTDQDKADLERQLEEKTNRTKDETDQLIKQYKEQNDALKKDIDGMRLQEANRKVDSKALELAQQLAAKNPAKAALLAKEFKSRIKLDDDGSVKVLDENGGVTISSVEQLVSEYSTKYAFLCDGVDSTGGGSHSSANTAPAKKFSEMSETERRDLYTTDVNKYRELKSREST